MIVRDVRAMSLGVIEREGGITKTGESYEGYTALAFVVCDEPEGRKFYIPSDTLKKKIRSTCAEWGTFFNIVSGDIDSKGRLTIEDVEKIEEA